MKLSSSKRERVAILCSMQHLNWNERENNSFKALRKLSMLHWKNYFSLINHCCSRSPIAPINKPMKQDSGTLKRFYKQCILWEIWGVWKNILWRNSMFFLRGRGGGEFEITSPLSNRKKTYLIINVYLPVDSRNQSSTRKDSKQ